MLNNPGKTFRDILSKPGIIVAPGVYDGISARITEQAGFKAAYLSGAGVAASGIGEPDIGLTTMSDLVHIARTLTIKAEIPYMCDADTGYGNPLNVIRTVHELEAANVACIQLEDQIAPKRCGHLAGKACVPAEEFVQKIRAASREKFSKDTLIIARTDARAVYSFDEAIERGKMYMEAGADILFIEAPQTIDEVEKISKIFAHQIPLLANQVIGGKTPRMTAKELEQLGYKILLFPDVLPFAASVLFRRILDKVIADGTSWDAVMDAPDSRELFNTMGMESWRGLEQAYKEGSR